MNNPAESGQNAAEVPVQNAGIVLFSMYIPLLFERLGIIENGQFTNATAQNDAVHYLQYLATGLKTTDAFLLPLNKILCGLDPAAAVTDAIAPDEEQEQLMTGLLNAAIAYWPEVGSSSPDGFRGNWFIRPGILQKTGMNWELTVAKRPYDLLLHKSPFSFSMIRFPWMKNRLVVKWPF